MVCQDSTTMFYNLVFLSIGPVIFAPIFHKYFFLKMSKWHAVSKCLSMYLHNIWRAAYLMRAKGANVVGTDFPWSLSLSLVLPVPTILAFPGHQSVSTRNDFQILKHVKRQTGQKTQREASTNRLAQAQSPHLQQLCHLECSGERMVF